MPRPGDSGEGVNDFRPPFQDAEGELTVHAEVVEEGILVRFSRHDVKVETDIEGAIAFGQWCEKYLWVQSPRWGSGEWDEFHFSASIYAGRVRLHRVYDSEHDYPDDEWPSPVHIDLSPDGARSLAIWLRLNLQRNAP